MSKILAQRLANLTQKIIIAKNSQKEFCNSLNRFRVKLRALNEQFLLLIISVVRAGEVTNHRDLSLENLKFSLDVENVHVKERIVSCGGKAVEKREVKFNFPLFYLPRIRNAVELAMTRQKM